MDSLATNYKVRRNTLITIIGVILAFVIFGYLIYPTLSLLGITLFEDGQLNLLPAIRILRSNRAVNALMNSLILAVALTITVNILGVFQILVLDYFNIKGRRWLNFTYHSSLVCNGMVLVTAYNFILGQNGFLTAALLNIFPNLSENWFEGFWAVLIQMTIANTFNHVVFVRRALNNIDYQTIEAAQNMGISPMRILLKVVFPTLLPSIFAASILTFLIGIGAFATPQVLGGPNFETINPLIMSFSQTLTTRNYAAILAIFLGFVTMTVLLISNIIERRRNYISVSKVKTQIHRQEIHNPFIKGIVTLLAHLIALVNIIPVLFVIIFSFMNPQDLFNGIININNFTLENYRLLMNSVTGLRPVLVSILYSALSSLIVVTLMLLVGRLITKYNNKFTNLLEALLQIPWFLPGTLIALGLIMTFDQPSIFAFGQTLTGSVQIMLIGYIIIRIPYTLRMIKASYSNVDNSIDEAARNLGVSGISTYMKVILPVIFPSVLSVFLLNFIGLLAEYEVSVFLFHPLFQPLGVALRGATSPGASTQSQMLSFVYSVIIIIISSIAILIVYGRGVITRLRTKKDA